MRDLKCDDTREEQITVVKISMHSEIKNLRQVVILKLRFEKKFGKKTTFKGDLRRCGAPVRDFQLIPFDIKIRYRRMRFNFLDRWRTCYTVSSGNKFPSDVIILRPK